MLSQRKICVFSKKNGVFFRPYAVPLRCIIFALLHRRVSHIFLEVRRKSVSATKNLRFCGKIAIFFRPPVVQFSLHKKEFLVHILGKSRFFARPSAALTKITKALFLSAARKKGKFLHFFAAKGKRGTLFFLPNRPKNKDSLV